MIKYDITEYNFLRKDTNQYQLSILYGMDSFAYMIQDANATPSVLALREYYWPEKKQDDFWKEDDHLQMSYRTVKVAFSKGLFCMVPQRLFQEEEKATYLGHMSQLSDSGNIFSDNLSLQQAELVYEVDGPALQKVEQHFAHAQKRNLHSVLLEAMRGHAAAQSSYHLAVLIGYKQILVYAFDRTTLMLANSYSYRMPQDLLYYVLLVYEQLGLKPDQVPLFLGGRMLEDSDIYRLLVRYIKHIAFLPPFLLKRGPQLERYPFHFFYDLYALGFSGR